MTSRLPASDGVGCATTLAINLFENFACAGIDQELRDALAELASLIGRSGRTLADVLLSVGRADDSVDSEFAAFEARPCAQRNLAAAFESSKESAFRNDGLASFVIVKRSKGVGNFVVFKAGLNAQSTLAYGWHANFWGDRKSTRLNSSHLGISYAVFCL